MDNPWGDENSDNEEKEQVEEETGKDALILLIDVRKNMIKENEQGNIFLRSCLQVAVKLMKSKIIAADKSLMGIVLFGSKEIQNENDLADVHELHSLDLPSADRIKELKDLIAADDEDFEELFGSKSNDEKTSISNALWHCGLTFTKKMLKQNDLQRVWIFTNDDNPNSMDEHERNKCVQKAADLAEQGRILNLFYQNGGAGKPVFRLNSFYKSMFSVFDEFVENTEDLFTKVSSPEDLLESSYRKQFKKRRLARLHFFLSEDVSFGVEVYPLLVEQKKSYPIKLKASTNEPVRVVTKNLCADTGVYLEPQQIKRYVNVGGERKYFTEEDIARLKFMGDPGIRLIHFQAKDTLKTWDNMRPPYFLYPSDELVEGSTKAFVAIHQQMKEKNVLAVAELLLRKNFPPHIVAIVPQDEEVDDFGQVTPFGFNMITLPYIDDICHVPLLPTADANTEQVDAARKLIKRLEIPNLPVFENPVIQKHFASIQAMALNEDELEFRDEDDATMPDKEGFSREGTKRILQRFQDLCGPDSLGYPEPKKKTEKRKIKTEAGVKAERTTKRVKVSDEDTTSVSFWKDLINSDKISSMTVKDMRTFLTSKNYSTAGRKAQLIEVIKEIVAENIG